MQPLVGGSPGVGFCLTTAKQLHQHLAAMVCWYQYLVTLCQFLHDYKYRYKGKMCIVLDSVMTKLRGFCLGC